MNIPLEYLQAGGGGGRRMSGPASWAPAFTGQYVFRFWNASTATRISAISFPSWFAGSQSLINVPLPLGEIWMPITGITVSAGTIYVFFT